MQRYHPDFVDYTNVVRSSQYYWLGTAALAGVALLIVYMFVAGAVARTTKSRREGVIAAAVAVGVGSVVYVAASLLTYATEPAASNRPSVIAGILFFEPPLGLCFIGTAMFLAWAAAGVGERTGRRDAPGRRPS